MFVIRELYAFNQPFGKPLLRDGFTLVTSAVDNEELGSALLPDITSSHKDRAQRVRLDGYLEEEAHKHWKT